MRLEITTHLNHFMVRAVGCYVYLTKRGTLSAEYGGIWKTRKWAQAALEKFEVRGTK